MNMRFFFLSIDKQILLNYFVSGFASLLFFYGKRHHDHKKYRLPEKRIREHVDGIHEFRKFLRKKSLPDIACIEIFAEYFLKCPNRFSNTVWTSCLSLFDGNDEKLRILGKICPKGSVWYEEVLTLFKTADPQSQEILLTLASNGISQSTQKAATSLDIKKNW